MWLCLRNVFRVPKVVIFFNALCNFKGHQLPLLIIHSLKNYLWEAIFYWGSFSHAQINQLYSKPVILCFNILDHRSPPNWKRDAALIMCHKWSDLFGITCKLSHAITQLWKTNLEFLVTCVHSCQAVCHCFYFSCGRGDQSEFHFGL